MQSATELSTAEIVQAAAAEAVARKPVKDRAADYRAEYAANPHYAKFGISEAEYIASRKIDEHGISFIPALSDEQLEQLSATLAEPVAKSAAAVSFAVGSEHFLAEDAELVIV